MRKRSALKYDAFKPTFLGFTAQQTTRTARKLQNTWRLYDLASAFSSTLALFIAIMDYEERWNDDRSHTTCRMHEVSEAYRFSILVLSLGALVLATIRHFVKLKWISVVSIAREVYNTRRANFLNFKFAVEIVALSIFPYPYFDKEVYLNQAVNQRLQLISLCYYWSELLFIGMFTRVFMFCRSLVNFSKYLDDTSYAYASDYGIKPNVRFSYRCLIREHPVIVIAVYLILTNLIFTAILRVFERPFQDFSGMNHRYYTSSMWLVGQTIFCMTYGDMYPWTNGGKVVCIICSIIGGFSFSYLVFLIERGLSLTSKERKVFYRVNVAPTAARIIYLSLRYSSAKRHFGTNSSEARTLYGNLMEALEINRRRTEFLRGKTSIADEIVVESQSRQLIAMMQRVERKMSKFKSEMSTVNS
jgi:hypothetical protein